MTKLKIAQGILKKQCVQGVGCLDFPDTYLCVRGLAFSLATYMVKPLGS
jgi:hypothetical protein